MPRHRRNPVVHHKLKPKPKIHKKTVKPIDNTIGPGHFYTFIGENGGAVTCWRGETPPTIVAGGARWNTVEVPRRVSFSQWQGRDLYAIDVPILFDGYQAGESVEPDIQVLRRMGMGMPYDPPPVITVRGALPISGLHWVIQNITWGSESFWKKDGNSAPYRLRQDAVVHLLEYHEETRVQVKATNTLPNFYIVTKGRTVTMRQIAKEMYGNGQLWTRIKKANPSIRDPNKIVGPKRLRVP